MALIKPKFEIANRYEGLKVIERYGATYGYLHNQDEEDFKVFDPAKGEFATDPMTGRTITPRLDVEYPMLSATFNTFNGIKCYANVMLTKSIDDFLKEECGLVGRDSYDVSVLLRLKEQDEVVTTLAGREAPQRDPLPEGHKADVITPMFK